MKLLLAALLAWVTACTGALPLRASTPEAWLPPTTVALASVPNVPQTRTHLQNNAWHRLWKDPAMAPFRNHATSQFEQDVLTPFRQSAGWDPAQALNLAQGAITLAILTPASGKLQLDQLEWVLLVDFGARIAEVRAFADAQWPSDPANNNPAIRTVPLPNIPAFGTMPPAQVWITFIDNWLFAASTEAALQDVATRYTQPEKPSLASLAAFQLDQNRSLHQADAYLWFNLRPWIQSVLQLADEVDARPTDPNAIPLPPRRKMLESSGLTAPTTLCLAARETASGTAAELSLGIQTDARHGLVRMLAPMRGDASPALQVGSDVVRFERLRLDFRQSWKAFETMLVDLFPQASNVLDLLFKTASPSGESSDLREELLGLLANDVVTLEYPPRGATPQALSYPPLLTQLTSTNADQLAISLKALSILLPPPLSNLSVEQAREHEVYSLPHPIGLLSSSDTPAPPALLFAAQNNKVAFTTDRKLLLDSFDAPQNPPTPLVSLPGLQEAANTIGGTGLGWFRFENTVRAMPWKLMRMRREKTLLPTWLNLLPQGTRLTTKLNAWLDPQKLPAFEEISQYFHFTVANAATENDRVIFRAFAPTPPSMLKTPTPDATPVPAATPPAGEPQ